jgi:hypothetical protein
MKSLRTALIALLLGASSLPPIRGNMPAVQTGQWIPLGAMSDARSGAAAVLLPDGLILVTGGSAGTGALASAEFLGPDGQFSAAGAMATARTNHAAVRLDDGRALVVGGRNADGAVATAETFAAAAGPPSDSSPTRAGGTPRRCCRTGACSSSAGRMRRAGRQRRNVRPHDRRVRGDRHALDRAQGHAAARLSDGRVIIAGGFTGAAVVASTELFDPETNSIVPVLR